MANETFNHIEFFHNKKDLHLKHRSFDLNIPF